MRTEALAVLLACAAGTAAAQDCDADLRALSALTGLIPLPSVETLAESDGWCSLQDLRLGGEQRYTPVVDIYRLTWRLSDPLTAQDGVVTLPRALDLTVAGLRIGTLIGDPVMDWLMQAQREAAPIDGALSVTLDPTTGTVQITALSLDFPGDNAIWLTTAVSGLALQDTRTLTLSLPQARLQSLDLSVTTHGLFETYALMTLGNVLLTHADDPEAEAQALRDAATQRIAAFPDAILSAPVKDSLTALVADLPNPAGTLHLTIDAPGGWGAERLAPVVIRGVQSVLDNPAPLFEGLDITFTYDRTTPAEGAAP